MEFMHTVSNTLLSFGVSYIIYFGFFIFNYRYCQSCDQRLPHNLYAYTKLFKYLQLVDTQLQQYYFISYHRILACIQCLKSCLCLCTTCIILAPIFVIYGLHTGVIFLYKCLQKIVCCASQMVRHIKMNVSKTQCIIYASTIQFISKVLKQIKTIAKIIFCIPFCFLFISICAKYISVLTQRCFCLSVYMYLYAILGEGYYQRVNCTFL